MMRHKICLITPYYGPLPFWMDAFYLSCSYNPSITWLLITDQPPPAKLPKNVKFIYYTLAELNGLFQRRLGFAVNISESYPYKLCDFKPIFGHIFHDYLTECDYWGHYDLDVVWGDLERLLEQELLEDFDVFTSRVGKISGHLCLYRNTEDVNHLYKSIPLIRFKLRRKHKYCAVDENHLSKLISSLHSPAQLKKLPLGWRSKNNFTPKIYWDKIWTTAGKTQRHLWYSDKLCFLWKKGRVYHYDGHELMYIHFHQLRPRMEQIDFTYDDDPSVLVINSNGIFAQT